MTSFHRLLLGAAAIASLAAAPAASAEDVLRVGAILAISGPASSYGGPAEKGLKLIFDSLAKEGLAGRKVKLSVYDTEGNSTKAVQFYRRLVDNDEVDVVLGPSTSGESLAVVPVANQLKVPNITYGGAEPITKPVTPYVFALSPTDRLVVESILDHLRGRGAKTAAVIYSTDGFGQSGGGIVQERAAAFGIDLVAVESFSPQDTNMTPQLLRVREKKPDAVIIWSANPAPTIVLRNAQEIGLKLPFYVSYANASLSFIAQTGAAAEGVYVAALPIVAPEVLPDSDPRKAPLASFDKAYRERWGVPPDQTSGHALDSKIVLDAALKAIDGPVTREALRGAIERVKMCGADGCREVTPEDHRGLDKNALVLMQVRDGRFQEVR
ncbi:ABC transporter substrate-binding protein [Chelatococcus reniformis]|uniref:Branched-chain amino acid ABC transporter substrate-binding protein n=1 Tax=Chelatococcus reniformis TaxID=1494448 RepID=A0A916XKD3_9HYPH|nr:ABC transporter substrate-binding protein [Chelatococcus reniformis]GGC78082.1 branched-chain amino acid ABC transporter substrate-binding protein [Chelatococcus reniformis]